MGACAYTIRNDGQITHIQVEGAVSADVLKKIVAEIWAGKDYAHPCILWDFRAAILGFGTSELRELGRFVVEHKENRGEGRVAIVVAKNFHVGISMIFEVLTNRLPFTIKTFQDLALAQTWLAERSPLGETIPATPDEPRLIEK